MPMLAVMIAVGGAMATHFSPASTVTQQAWGRNSANQCVSGNVEDDCADNTGPVCTFISGTEIITANSDSLDCDNPATTLQRPEN